MECLNFKFEDTPEGKFIETIIAAQGELERLQGRRQTIQKMKARVEQGFYVFKVPVGYRYEKADGKGKMLVRNEPLASIVQEALEGFACGRFQIQAEVRRYLETKPQFPKPASEAVRAQNVTNILTRSVYAGFVEAPAWGVTLRKGHHDALISAETYRTIQERLTDGARVSARKDISADFPLRGFVLCGDCGSALTACWSVGRWKGRFPYYLCAKTGCASYRKSIRRQVLEGEFGELLERLTPSPMVFKTCVKLFEDLWSYRLGSRHSEADAYKAQLIDVERKVQQFLDRIADADVPSIVKAYEDRIRKLQEDRAILKEKIARCASAPKAQGDILRTALDFLASPCALWRSDRLQDRRMVLKLTFLERLANLRNEGFRTPVFSFPFKLLAEVSGGKIEVASLSLESSNQLIDTFTEWSDCLAQSPRDADRSMIVDGSPQVRIEYPGKSI